MSYLYDITQGVIYKKVLQQLKCYYPFTNFIIKPISRIFTNNIVYKASAIEHNIFLCVKTYLNSNNASYRFATEKKFTNDYFNEIHHMEETNFIRLRDDDIYGISIRKWVEGNSAMDMLLKNPKRFLNEDANKIIHLMKRVWGYSEKSEPFQYLKFNNVNLINSLENYITAIVKEVHIQCEHLLLKRGSIERLINALKKEVYLAYRNNNFYDFKITIINSDPSLYEFIFCTDKIIWIDWEYVNLGSQLVDIASLYYSIANNLWKDEKMDGICLDFFARDIDIDNRKLFGLFLLRKVITCDEFTEYIEPVEKLQWGLEKSLRFLQE